MALLYIKRIFLSDRIPISENKMLMLYSCFCREFNLFLGEQGHKWNMYTVQVNLYFYYQSSGHCCYSKLPNPHCHGQDVKTWHLKYNKAVYLSSTNFSPCHIFASKYYFIKQYFSRELFTSVAKLSPSSSSTGLSYIFVFPSRLVVLSRRLNRNRIKTKQPLDGFATNWNLTLL